MYIKEDFGRVEWDGKIDNVIKVYAGRHECCEVDIFLRYAYKGGGERERERNRENNGIDWYYLSCNEKRTKIQKGDQINQMLSCWRYLFLIFFFPSLPFFFCW